MKKVYVIASFYLKSPDFLEDWKKLSAHITEELSLVDGFLSREAAQGKDGKIYCILTRENKEKQEAFAKQFEQMQKDNPEQFSEFWRIADVSAMNKEILEVL